MCFSGKCIPKVILHCQIAVLKHYATNISYLFHIIFVLLFLRHTVQSGIWNDHNLAYFEGRGYTIREAINYWYHNGSEIDGGVVFRDQCYVPRCNDGCPEKLTVLGLRGDVWSSSARFMVAAFVVTIAIMSVLLKVK